MTSSPIPVVLLAYARPAHLARVLACLKENAVPRVYAFADGAKGAGDAAAVAEVRGMLRAIDWCEVRLTERSENMGLGKNVLAGVSEVAATQEAFIVWEDDLVAVPGTYAWVCAALRHYAADERVMSVSAWTHPRVTPADVTASGRPYLDARAECWVWGAWARSWRGMTAATALEKMAKAEQRGVAADAYGADLPAMARVETRKNIWAVRWLYHHLATGGLSVRPPWSMVEHIGFDAGATNAAEATEWANPPLRAVPPIPATWPDARENAECRALWSAANPRRSRATRVKEKAKSWAKRIVPPGLRAVGRGMFGWRWFEGSFATWAEARAASRGYDDAVIVERVATATEAVRAGRAAFERDGVLFPHAVAEPGLSAAWRKISEATAAPWNVVDFGGALGTTYWRHRAELAARGVGAWDVVEQARFVAAGRAQLADGPVRFFSSLADAQAAGPHEVLVASTVVQYLEAPEVEIERWLAAGFTWLVLNNVPLHRGAPDRLAVQRVPPEFYPASYPVWFFNRERFLARFNGRYDVVDEFAAEAVWQVGWRRYPSTGLLLRRREAR